MMPVARWGWQWVRTNYASTRGLGRAVIVGAGIVGAIMYLVTGLWFDAAHWALARFAPDRVGRLARNGISIGIAVAVIVALASGEVMATIQPKQSAAPIAAVTATQTLAAAIPAHASAGPSTGPSLLVDPTGAPIPTPTSTSTPIDGDDEVSPSAAPGTSFMPGPTGARIPPGSGSTADRLPGEPDPTRTPGALNPAVTQATIGSTICVSGWTATIRPPSNYTTALKIEQISEYGYADTSTAAYEEDHLISLELGGSPTDPRNLWPEPYTASLADGRPTGAHIKDGFETKLKNQVCAGTITLASAQSEIGVHWVHAYYGIPIAAPSATPMPLSATPAPTATTASVAPTPVPVASLSVQITSLPASINHGANATMVALTSPGATCGASVTYASGTVSTAAGLQTHPVADSAGSVSWTWKVGTSTKPGTSTASVTCQLGGESASDSASFEVT
jgi:hypothetical protein